MSVMVLLLRLPIFWFLIIQPVMSAEGPPVLSFEFWLWQEIHKNKSVVAESADDWNWSKQQQASSDRFSRCPLVANLFNSTVVLSNRICLPLIDKTSHFGWFKYLQEHLNTCCYGNHCLFDLFETVLRILMCSNFKFFVWPLSASLIQLIPLHLQWLRQTGLVTCKQNMDLIVFNHVNLACNPRSVLITGGLFQGFTLLPKWCVYGIQAERKCLPTFFVHDLYQMSKKRTSF